MNKYEKAATGAVALMLVAGAAIFLYAPTDYLQGPVQRIFYLHVSSAIAAYGCFAVVLVGGIIYLRAENPVADRFARAGAIVGLVFTTVTLVMGMLWAKPIWNTFWTWDARLTSTLVLWMIYAGYLLVRRLADPGRQSARLAAVVGIFGFIDVPVVHFSVTWWRTVPPGPIIVHDALPPPMRSRRVFATRALTARSRWSARSPSCPTSGRICRRAISPGQCRLIDFRYAPPSSTGSCRSSSCSATASSTLEWRSGARFSRVEERSPGTCFASRPARGHARCRASSVPSISASCRPRQSFGLCSIARQ